MAALSLFTILIPTILATPLPYPDSVLSKQTLLHSDGADDGDSD